MTHGRILQATAAVKEAANALMRAAADEQLEQLPYFCECDDTGCLRAVWLSPAEYDRRKENDSTAPLLSNDHRRPLARVG